MSPKKLLLLDTAYSLQAIKTRGLERSITCTDLNGYFEHVWIVHPFASLVSKPDWGAMHGRPTIYELSNRHTYIEGKIGISRLLRRLLAINFLFSQANIFFHLFRFCRLEKISVIRAGDPLYLKMFAWVFQNLHIFLSLFGLVPITKKSGSPRVKL